VRDGGELVARYPVELAQEYYCRRVNRLLAEENLAYVFANGEFQRRGRPHTQKSLQRVGAVLGDSRYQQARAHYNKAVGFFNERPDPDVHNCIKEDIKTAACSKKAGNTV
jgi:hypothetical protein